MEMSGANRFLAEHCGKTLNEIAEQVKGISHSVNRCNAEYADSFDAVKELRSGFEALHRRVTDANAAIGKLQEQVATVEERVATLEDSMNKSREAYSKLLNKQATPQENAKCVK